MTARILTAVATIAWLVAGVVAGRSVVAGPATAPAPVPAVTEDADVARVVEVAGLAERAAVAWARGGRAGTAGLTELPRRPGLDLRARDAEHYVERATVVSLDHAGDDWVAVVRIDALRVRPDGYEPVGHVHVSVPITRHAEGWALSGQPLHRPTDSASAGTAG